MKEIDVTGTTTGGMPLTQISYAAQIDPCLVKKQIF